MTNQRPTADELEAIDATEHTPVDQADTLPAFDPYTAPENLNPGDFIQASRGREDDDEPVESAEGTVAAANASEVQIGSRIFTVGDGWKFEVIRANITLPESLSEIDATLYSAQGTVRLMGKGQIWTSGVDGRTIPASDIQSFELVP